MVVARVHLNKLTAEAYAKCFRAVFDQVKASHPKFAVGKSLCGVIMDWSDQQYNGLEIAVGASVAEEVSKGCRVRVYV